MRFYGGKARVAREFSVVMKKAGASHGGLPYFEPFLGGGNVFVRMANSDFAAIACDRDRHVMRLFTEFKRGWTPPQRIYYDDYLTCKREIGQGICTAYHAFVGFACSFGGIFYDSFAKPKDNRLPSRDAYNFFMKNETALRKAQYVPAQSYAEFEPHGMLIYCDPPQTRHEFGSMFDYPKFWARVKTWSKTNVVFVSAVCAPPEYTCVLEQGVYTTQPGSIAPPPGAPFAKRRVERLYTFNQSNCVGSLPPASLTIRGGSDIELIQDSGCVEIAPL